jgi:hypothetical protein
MPRAKKTPPTPPAAPACTACRGEGQIETFLIVGRGKNASTVDTWAFCFDCEGTGTGHEPERR